MGDVGDAFRARREYDRERKARNLESADPRFVTKPIRADKKKYQPPKQKKERWR